MTSADGAPTALPETVNLPERRALQFKRKIPQGIRKFLQHTKQSAEARGCQVALEDGMISPYLRAQNSR